MKPGEISQHHLWTGTLGVMLVAAFYSLPRTVALLVSTAAPWALLLAGGVTFLMLLPVVRLLARGRGQNLTDLALEAGGRPLAIAVALLFNASILTGVGLSLRQASELVVTALYPHTPQTFAMSTLIIASAVGAALTPSGAFWLASLFAWPALVSILLLLVGNVGWGQLRNVMPATGHGIWPTLAEVIPLASAFSPAIQLVVFSQFLPSPGRLVRGSAMAVGAAAATLALVVLFSLMVFPLPGGTGIPFPLFEMSRLVQGGRFLERVDTVWIVVWAFGSVLRTALALMAGARLLQEAFRLPDHRGAVLPLAIATMSVALFPAHQAGAIEAEAGLFRLTGYLIFFVLPLVISVIARIRRKPARTGGGA